MSRRGLSKFDTSLISNDGGKYSPSIRRLRQHYFHETKISPEKPFSSSLISPSNEWISSPLKCDDCQKHDGLFQCYHCQQRLCIRCCNKHYKKVTMELEYLHELSNRLLTKIFRMKTDLERQKNATIEQCQQWRIDTINTINTAHTLIVQTIHDEYEILSKEYEQFVEKEISEINIDQNELLKMKKGNLGSLLSTSTNTTNSKKSIDGIKQRMEIFNRSIDDIGKCSFQVKLPTFHIDETLRVESAFGGFTRSTTALQNDIPSTKSEELSAQQSAEVINTSSIEHGNEVQSDPSKNSSPIPTSSFTRHHTYHPTSSLNNNEILHVYQNVQQKPDQPHFFDNLLFPLESMEKTDGIIRRHSTSMQARRRTTAILPSFFNTAKLPINYP